MLSQFYICYSILLPYANLLIYIKKQKSKREIRLIPQSTILKSFVHPCIRQLNLLHPKIKEYKIGRPPSLFANPVWTFMYFYLIQYKRHRRVAQNIPNPLLGQPIGRYKGRGNANFRWLLLSWSRLYRKS